MAGQVRTWPPNGTSPTWPTSNIERSYIIIFELGHSIFHSKGKNKNRGTSVVKRHVPFLFSVFVKAAVPEPPSPRRRERSKPECRALPKEKESMEWRNRNPLQKVPQPWLDLTNLAVTTGYHSLSRLSSPLLNFFRKKFFSGKLGTCAKNLLPLLCKIHPFPLAFSRDRCYYSVKAAGRGTSRASPPIRPPPESRIGCGFSKAQ
jgi:hypothetical protein